MEKGAKPVALGMEKGLTPAKHGPLVHLRLEPLLVGDKFLGSSVFVWSKVLSMISAIASVILLINAAGEASEGHYFQLTIAVPTAVLAIVTIVNVFYWHRWLVYAVFAIWQGSVAIIVGLVIASGVLLSGSEPDETGQRSDDPSSPALKVIVFAATSLILLVALAFSVITFIVFEKAAKCQRRHDGLDIL
ncbi:hypothetical protein AAVH_12289 [Aphelenchoides avenae]|nr:hypothetical protein AAVH_12289 [Aphelenchus avenae]